MLSPGSARGARAAHPAAGPGGAGPRRRGVREVLAADGGAHAVRLLRAAAAGLPQPAAVPAQRRHREEQRGTHRPSGSQTERVNSWAFYMSLY